ncbi:MAG: hypothetical protein U9N61_03300 [Euryarchaeota archaeon]|nr:hypothetical protein [Euryarchaeota archaeon]
MSEEQAMYNARRTAKGYCRHCERKTSIMLGRTIARNGVSQVYWVCLACGKPAEKNRYIPHEVLKNKGIELKQIRVVEDYSEVELCARCGKPNTEYHHWAPQYLFDDAGLWPGDYLCTECHRKWHVRVTPEMSKNE